MRSIICDDLSALNKAGADQIASVVGAKPTAAIVVATGNSPMGIYNELGARTARGQFDATQASVFQLDEYFGLASNDNRSLYAWMDRDFIQPLRISLNKVVRLHGDMSNWRENCRTYDEAVNACGGFDLAILGIGANGHLGYNEPGSHAHSQTRALLLSEASLTSSVGYGFARNEVPLAALTCGLQHLLAAKVIVLVASGAHKREILTRALYGPIGPEVPASYLQTVRDKVILVLDKEAAPEQLLAETGMTASSETAQAIAAPALAVKHDLVLAVDGGNTKTVAVVAQRDGRVLGYGRSGCGDMYGATPDGAMRSIDQAVQAALTMAGIKGTTLGSAAFCLAGCDWPEDHTLLKRLLAERQYASSFKVLNDAAGGLRSGSPQGWGVAISCGTWVATIARARKSSTWHRSPWQTSGGGGGLAHMAMEAVYRAHMGMGPRTVLTEKVLSFFNEQSVEGLLHLFTKREGPHPQAIHRLAPAVLDAAASGDTVASGLIFTMAAGLSGVALAMARQAGIARQAFPLVLSGSVFKHSSRLLPDAIIANVHAAAPKAQVFRSELEPVAGALLLAIEGTSRRIDRRLRDRLRSSMPEASFFAT